MAKRGMNFKKEARELQIVTKKDTKSNEIALPEKGIPVKLPDGKCIICPVVLSQEDVDIATEFVNTLEKDFFMMHRHTSGQTVSSIINSIFKYGKFKNLESVIHIPEGVNKPSTDRITTLAAFHHYAVHIKCNGALWCEMKARIYNKLVREKAKKQGR